MGPVAMEPSESAVDDKPFGAILHYWGAYGSKAMAPGENDFRWHAAWKGFQACRSQLAETCGEAKWSCHCDHEPPFWLFQKGFIIIQKEATTIFGQMADLGQILRKTMVVLA